MKYTTLLLDIDNTILDFSASEDIAFRKLLEALNIPYSDELKHHYKEVNHQLWSDYEKGLIKSESIKENRFAKSFEAYGVSMSGLEMDKLYREFLEDNTVLMPNALELLDTIHDTINLVVVTNGIASSQYKRLENVGIKSRFDWIAISSEIGFTKPSVNFFEPLSQKVDSLVKEKTLIVGDSLTADIQGGLNWGIDTCWYNPKRLINKSGIQPKYEIHDLLDILNLIKKEA